MDGSVAHEHTKDAAPTSAGGVSVIKADGTREIFDVTKLKGSLERAGATPGEVAKVLEHIERELQPGMTTARIYRHAHSVLSRMSKHAASRYSLKRAILELGPSGFPFEDYVAALFRAKGYTTKSREYVTGACVRHEIDLIAEKEGHCIAAEIKFHNKPGLKSDLKVALYIHARFLDIIERKRERGQECNISEGWAITNTKFTSEAHAYAACAGLSILDWSHPHEGNLQDWIEETRTHPLTCLTSLTRSEKTSLLNKGTVLCNALPDSVHLLHEVGVSEKKVDTVLKEVENLCRV